MEQPLLFGNSRLVGVLTLSASAGDRPCVLILNAGLIYRAGPGRLSVEFARHACDVGFSAFRFDLSGIGDSESRPQALTSVQSAVADAREAMNVLSQRFGFKRFILLGLCSGAIHSHYIAWNDARVVGVVMLDGYVFESNFSATVSSLTRLRPLLRLPQRMLRRASSIPSPSASSISDRPDEGAVLPRWPSRESAVTGLKALKQRGVALLQVFSGEWDLYRYEGQLRDALRCVDYGPLRQEVRIPTAEHLYLTSPERLLLFRLLTRWLTSEPWKTDKGATGRAERT